MLTVLIDNIIDQNHWRNIIRTSISNSWNSFGSIWNNWFCNEKINTKAIVQGKNSNFTNCMEDFGLTKRLIVNWLKMLVHTVSQFGSCISKTLYCSIKILYNNYYLIILNRWLYYSEWSKQCCRTMCDTTSSCLGCKYY